MFLQNYWLTKGVKSFFQKGPFSEILTLLSLWHAVSIFWSCVGPEPNLSSMKLRSGDKHCTQEARSNSDLKTDFKYRLFGWPFSDLVDLCPVYWPKRLFYNRIANLGLIFLPSFDYFITHIIPLNILFECCCTS